MTEARSLKKFNIIEYFKDLDEEDPVKLWFVFYLTLFSISLMFGIVFGYFLPSKEIDVDSARYLLSALIQSQAAVISIVITLTLIAVQLTSQAYSPHVKDIFKNHPHMWFLLGSYIISIGISSVLLIHLVGSNLLQDTGRLIILYLSFFHAIFLFIALIPFILVIINLLNPKTILTRLTNSIIIKDKIGPEEDPFQAVFDVIYASIRRFDFASMDKGLYILEEKVEKIITENEQNYQISYILFRLFNDYKRCGFILIEMNEENYLYDIINHLQKTAEWALNKNNSNVIKLSSKTIEKIGIQAANYRLLYPIEHAIQSLLEISEKVGMTIEINENKLLLDNIHEIIDCIGNIGKRAIFNNIFFIGHSSIQAIVKLAFQVIEIKIELSENIIPSNIEKIGDISIEKNSQGIIKLTINSFDDIISKYIEVTLEDETIASLNSLTNLGIQAVRFNQIFIAKSIAGILFSKAVAAHDNDMKRACDKAINQLALLKLSNPKEFEDFKPLRYPDIAFDILTTHQEEEWRYALEIEYHNFSEWIKERDEFLHD